MSFCKELIESIGKLELFATIYHPIILSLAGQDELSRLLNRRIVSENELVRARNNFYIQDYYYLIYAYKFASLFTVDSSNNNYLKKKILGLHDNVSYNKALHNPFVRRQENPFSLFTSGTIQDLRSYIEDTNGIQIEGTAPSKVIKDYISLKIDSTFQGELEAMISGLPCLYVYRGFAQIFKKSPSPYLNYYELDREGQVIYKYRDWLKFLSNPDYEDDYQNTERTINQLVTEIDSEVTDELKEKLEIIFLRACKLELDFMNSLLI